ncbi:MAG: amino acid deaminase [Subtercola sp.]|nr:amino acid deaminase [Subtercola sp.]
MAADGEFIKRLLRASDAVARLSDSGVAGDAGATGDAPTLEVRQANVSQILAEHVPELLISLERDRAAGTFAHWGLSTVHDETAGRPVIGRPLFELLHRVSAVECAWPIGNAGVLHTYGYLLSTVETAYGFKRERWIGGELASAFGMRADAFLRTLVDIGSPNRSPGLLTLVTGQVRGVLEAAEELLPPPGEGSSGGSGRAADTGFDGDPRRGTSSAADSGLGSGSGTGSGSGAGSGTNIRAVVDEFAGEEREEIARAVFVEANSDPDARAVVYAVLLGRSTQLITAFPVTASPAEWIAGVMGSPPRLRYNAAAHELPPRSALASRRIRTHDFRTADLPTGDFRIADLPTVDISIADSGSIEEKL